jgi:competence protein ComEA
MAEWVERHRWGVVFALVLAVASGCLLLWRGRPQPAPILISTPEPTVSPTHTPTPTPAPLRIYVTGAVRAPDVYTLPPGSIVKDALAAAGGVTDEADLDRINLARQLADQEQVYVPRRGEEEPPPVAEGPSSRASPLLGTGRVNINRAGVEELDTLPGIGPAIAQRIVDYRAEHGPFSTIEEITNVKGIGAATFDELRERIAIE